MNQLDEVYHTTIITKEGCNYVIRTREESDFTIIPLKFQVCIIPLIWSKRLILLFSRRSHKFILQKVQRRTDNYTLMR